MDEIQKSLVSMVAKQPTCTKDRVKFKSIMQDYIPNDKLQQNILLNAYDENIVAHLTDGNDAALQALKIVKNLTDSYGLIQELSLWAVETWCFMLGLNEIGDLLVATNPIGQPEPNKPSNVKPTQESVLHNVIVGSGTYKAEVDFASGNLKLMANHKDSKKWKIYYGIGTDPNKIKDDHSFIDQTYVNINSNQFLKINCIQNSTTVTITVV